MNGDWLTLGAVAALALAGSRRGSRAHLSSLDLVEHVERPAFGRQPVRWATGVPVTFDFSHNTEPSPYYGARYGQDLEPAGRYVVTHTLDPKHHLPGFVYGSIHFDNPIVLASVWPVEGQYGGAEGWKHKLSVAFGGKRGLALTRALIAAGYDGIVTVTLPGAHSSQGPYLSEIVELGVMSRQRPRGSPSLVRQIQSHLSPDLLDPSRKGTGRGPQGGHCYVASQALWHLLGGKRSGYTPQVGPAPGGGTHWWLRQDRTGRVLDPTASQFRGYDYDQGVGKGFQTQKPSKRAQTLIDRVQRGSRQRGSTNDEELPFLLEVSRDGWCDAKERFMYPWEDGDPLPTDADLRKHAAAAIEEYGGPVCDWEYEGDWNTSGGWLTREFELARTLDGRLKIK